jgi:predicted SAM-dependent methyltransferase
MKIIVGAGRTYQPGWTSLEQSELDITNRFQWARRFAPASLDVVLAEHVFEHLTVEEGYAAARNCFEYLKPKGYLRVAVPDGLHPDPQYIKWVEPVTGYNGDDHKVLYDYRTLSVLLMKAGFDVRVLECWDENGDFRMTEWSQADGNISRCLSHYWTQYFLNIIVNTQYTSVIIDAFKR